MRTSLRHRAALSDARRVVVKIGTRVIVQRSGRPEPRRMRALVKELARLRHQGYEVVVITSGAIGAGMEALGMAKRPGELPDLQMAAAVGQTRLMTRYDRFFSAERCRVGQILLTHDDFHHRIRVTNARRTMENLLRNKVIPIVNENDAVADEEIRAVKKLGDNDLLAAMVVKLIRADLLIILTTVDGVHEPPSGAAARRIRCLETITRRTLALAAGKHSDLSTGGMATKLKAAQFVTRSGCYVVIANGRRAGTISRIMRGEDVGTLVLASVSA